MSIKEHPPQLHVPVLHDQVVRLLAPQPGESYLDLTAGYGGHARTIIDRTAAPGRATLVDRDPQALDSLTDLAAAGVHLVPADFASAAQVLAQSNQRYDMVLADLGVSSPQLDRPDRGFSFLHDGPLDMRMDPGQATTAATLVNTTPVAELARIIVRYGEERPTQARRIAQAIVDRRPLERTGELAAAVLAAHRGPRQRAHPATRTFQAIRIAVNQELTQVEALLPLLPRLLRPGGRLAIISFHSLEDRLVKRYLAEQSQAGYEAQLRVLTKKPIDGATYDVHNPRSRSAKLRVAVKT